MKLVTLKNQENKQTNVDHISNFTISSTITGLLVTESNEVENSENWPQTGVHNDEWFDEYMKKHCVVSVSQTDLGDCIRVTSSDADVFGIRGFVVTLDAIYNQTVKVFENNTVVGIDNVEVPTYKQLEIVVPHHNFFGSEGVDVVHNVLKGLGLNHIARAERIREMTNNDIRLQNTFSEFKPSDPFEHTSESEGVEQKQTEAKFSQWRTHLPTRIHSTFFRATILGTKANASEMDKNLSAVMTALGFTKNFGGSSAVEELETIKNYFEVKLGGYESVLITANSFRSIGNIANVSLWQEFKETLKSRVFSHAKKTGINVMIDCVAMADSDDYRETASYDHTTGEVSRSINTVGAGVREFAQNVLNQINSSKS